MAVGRFIGLFNDMYGFYAGLHPLVQTAFVAVVVGLVVAVLAWLAKRAVVAAARRSPHIDTTLERFLSGLMVGLGAIFVVLAILLVIGVPAVTLGAIVAAAGFVVGFALRDTLGNLAAGVLLLVNRPYLIGEGVSILGHDGIVLHLGVATTRIKTWDGRLVTVPNGAIMKQPILNHTRHATRMASVNVSIAYDDDIEVAIRTALATAKAHPETLDEPAPDVVVNGLGADGVDLIVRAWVETTKWFRTQSELRGRVKRDLEAAGCTIPFPQRDVHLYAREAASPAA